MDIEHLCDPHIILGEKKTDLNTMSCWSG